MTTARRPAAAALFAAALLAAGCADKPRAPALRNEAVYQNIQEGFRFLVPEGWAMHTRANLPPGPLEKEHILVAYQRRSAGAGRPAAFEVSCADLPESADLAAHVAASGPGKDGWRAARPPEPVAAGNVQGVRVTLAGRAGNEGTQREVVAVRRGGRVYFFTLLAAPADTAARDQARQAVGSLLWKE
jgi:hypothetical protein